MPDLAEAVPSGALRAAVRAEIEPLFADLRRFVDRRVAELSAELHGAVQIVDDSEANLAGRLGEMQAELARLVASPAPGSRNSGLELEAVVQATEAAANRIMEAAEAIDDWVRAGSDPAGREAVSQRIAAIFEACSFQDLTGQRVRRAIQRLQHVEGMLAEMGDGSPAAAGGGNGSGRDLAQEEIDRLLA